MMDPVDDGRSQGDTSSEVVIENALDLHSEYVKNPSKYTVYTRRWFILSAIVVVNFTNALVSEIIQN